MPAEIHERRSSGRPHIAHRHHMEGKERRKSKPKRSSASEPPTRPEQVEPAEMDDRRRSSSNNNTSTLVMDNEEPSSERAGSSAEDSPRMVRTMRRHRRSYSDDSGPRLPDIHRHRHESHSHRRYRSRPRRHQHHRHERRHHRRRSSSEEGRPPQLPRVSSDNYQGGADDVRRKVHAYAGDRYDDYSSSDYSSSEESPSGSSDENQVDRRRRRRRHEHKRHQRRREGRRRRSTRSSSSSAGSPRERQESVEDETLPASPAVDKKPKVTRLHRAARKIQGAYRRHWGYTRALEHAQRYAYLKIQSHWVLEELLDEHLRCDVIPDLLIEVIMQSMETDCTSLSVHDLAARDCLGVVVRETVAEVSQQVVETEIHRFIHKFLREHRPKDPLTLLVNDVVAETIAADVRGVAEEAILENTFAYLLERRCLDTWSTISDEVIRGFSLEIARSLLFEERLHDLQGTILDEVASEVATELVDEVLVSMTQERAIRREQEEFDAVVSAAMRTILPRMEAQLLLGIVRKRSEDLVIRDISETILERLLAGRLLALHREITERMEQMRECPSLMLLFNQLTSRTAFPLLLKELQGSLPNVCERIREAEIGNTVALSDS